MPRRDDGEAAEHPVHPDARHDDHAHQGEHQDERDAEGGLLLHQGDQRRGGEERVEHVPDRRAARGQFPARQQPRGGQHKTELGELRRLDLETAGQRDPRLRAVHRLADDEHRREQQQRQDVQVRGQALDHPVVDQRGDEHQQQAEHRPDDRLLQVGVRVEAGLAQERLGRRPDEHGADRGERAGRGDQQPVPRPGDAALGERAVQRRPAVRREGARPRSRPAPGRETDAHFAASFGRAGRTPPGSAAPFLRAPSSP